MYDGDLGRVNDYVVFSWESANSLETIRIHHDEIFLASNRLLRLRLCNTRVCGDLTVYCDESQLSIDVGSPNSAGPSLSTM